jgi:hypothetical protein
VLGIASLALPSGPTYDPYAWLIWGRDLAHLDLVTSGTGTSWKPLPAMIDALLSPLGGRAASGWLVVARAGALFAVVMAFKLAWRVAPAGRRLLAGTLAGATLLLTQYWVRQNGVGYAEGLAVALALLAVDRHLDGKRTQAFALIVGVGLMRVEAWPFALVYGGWLWWTTAAGRARRGTAVAGGLLLLPLVWFGGDWIGSGSLTTAADRALKHKPGTPGASAHPALAVLGEAFSMLPVAAWPAIVFALLTALIALARRRTNAPTRMIAAFAAVAAAWTAIVAAMAQHGYAGLPRYLFVADGLEAVLAGVGAAFAVDAIVAVAAQMRAPRPARAAGLGAALLVCALFGLGSLSRATQLPADAASIDSVADMDSGLANAVRQAGGPGGVLRCGRPATTWYTVTALAWDLGVPSATVRDRPHGPRPVVFTPARGNWDVRAHGCRDGATTARQPAPRGSAGAGSRTPGRSSART